MSDLIKILAGLLVVVGIAFSIAYTISDNKEWQKFRDDHHCQLVSHTPGTTAWSTGGHAVFISGQDGYKCDDGVVYYRSN